MSGAGEHQEVEPFRVDVEPSREHVRVAPVGELDLATTAVLKAEIDRLRETGFDRLVLDLRRLRFMDSTGLRLVLEFNAAARSSGWSFSLIRGPAAIQRLFEITHLDERLSFSDPE